MSTTLFFVIALFCLAFMLLAIELFLVPGLGIVGPIGFIILVADIVYTWTTLGALWGLVAIGISLIVSLAALWIFPKTKAAKSLVLDKTHKGTKSLGTDYSSLVGKTGIALTPLRPSGTGEFADERFDVISDGEFIEKNSPIRIVATEGVRIVVEIDTTD